MKVYSWGFTQIQMIGNFGFSWLLRSFLLLSLFFCLKQIFFFFGLISLTRDNCLLAWLIYLYLCFTFFHCAEDSSVIFTMSIVWNTVTIIWLFKQRDGIRITLSMKIWVARDLSSVFRPAKQNIDMKGWFDFKFQPRKWFEMN